MEEEDTVVTEIPVLLSQALAKHLYIFQYPVRPGTADWNDTKVVNSLIKPQNQQVRLEFGLDTFSDKYCASKGEQIALNTDGHQESSRYINSKEREKTQYFKTGTMDKMVYESLAQTVGSNYAVAILQDKELHCTPVNSIVQMRPAYSYFDKQDKRVRDTKRAENSEDEEEEEPSAQQVTVSFARQESDVAKKARESSFEFMSKRSAEEAWCDAVWRHADTDHAEQERLKLFSPNTTTGAALSLPPPQYLPSLVPPPPAEETISPDAATALEPPDMRSVRELPLVDQCKAILKDAKLMTYTELVSLIKSHKTIDKATLVSALSTAGCCVRGLWAALSTDLYRQRSHVAGVPAPLMCAARDYVLYLFTQSSHVDRRKVSAAVRLPAEEVLEILKSVAKYNPRTGWELLHPPDVTFESSFPDVVHRQNLYWEAKQRQFHEMMSGERDIPKRQRKKSQRESFSSDTMMSPKARSTGEEDSDRRKKARCGSTGEEDGDRKKKNKSATGTGKRTRNQSVGNDSAL